MSTSDVISPSVVDSGGNDGAEDEPTVPALSKRAKKRALKQQYQQEKRKQVKEAKKEARRAKRAEGYAEWERMDPAAQQEAKDNARAAREAREAAVKAEVAQRKAAASEWEGEDKFVRCTKPTVILDMSFDELMKENEIKSLAQQVSYSYSANRHASYPVRLGLTSLAPTLQGKLTAGHQHWPLLYEHQNYLDVFPDRRRLVYLSSESEVLLDTLAPGEVYIVGGLVDHNRHKGLTHRRALEAGVRTARLPIDEHLAMSQRRVLAVNHVVEILVYRASGPSWPAALVKPCLNAVVPRNETAMPPARPRRARRRVKILQVAVPLQMKISKRSQTPGGAVGETSSTEAQAE